MSSVSHCSTSTQLNDILSQRAQHVNLRTLSFTNPNRIEIDNPYLNSNLTSSDFDMRRKAEILQYNKNAEKVTNKSNSHRWIEAVRPRGHRNFVNCPINVPVPPYCSDVPTRKGDPAALYLDPNVPLYNYVNPINDRNYTAFSASDPDFLFHEYSAVSLARDINNNTSTIPTAILASVMFTNTILSDIYYLTVSIPIAFQITNFGHATTTLKIRPVISIYYNDTPVFTVPINATNYSFPETLTLTTTNASNQITQYLGTINTHMTLNAIPNVVYTVRINWDVASSNSNSTNVNMSSAILLANVLPSFTNTSLNATLSGTNSLPVATASFYITSTP